MTQTLYLLKTTILWLNLYFIFLCLNTYFFRMLYPMLINSVSLVDNLELCK